MRFAEDECLFFTGFLIMKRNGFTVDNLGRGGLLEGFNVSDGVFTLVTDDAGICFKFHPYTGVKI